VIILKNLVRKFDISQVAINTYFTFQVKKLHIKITEKKRKMQKQPKKINLQPYSKANSS